MTQDTDLHGSSRICSRDASDLELSELQKDREDLEAVKEILKNPRLIPWNKAKKKLRL